MNIAKSLEQMSDLELECKLHNVLGLGGDGSDSLSYCSDWNATMPLAIKNGVFVGEFQGSIIAYYELNAFPDGQYVGHELDVWFKSENPLRAIVMCLIKVLEGNK